MRVEIFIEPHEKYEAIDAYAKYLSEDQKDEIADHQGRVKLDIDTTFGHTIVEKL